MIERWVTFLLAYTIAATSAIAASLYGFMSASGYYGIAKGVGLALVALIGCHGLAWTVRLKRELGWPAATFGAIVTAACFAVTLLGGIGTITSGTATLVAGNAKAVSDANRDRVELDRLRTERMTLQFKPIDAAGVQAARDASDAATRNKEDECNSGRGSRCRDREADEMAARQTLVDALANHAATEQAKRLDDQIATLSTRLDGAKAAVVIDPQASAFAQLTGFNVDTAAAVYAFMFAVALELAAMFALLVAHSRPVEASHIITASRLEVASHDPMLPAPEPPSVVADKASIMRFMLACLSRDQGSHVEARQVYFRFVQWCGEQSPPLAPLDPVAFAEAFKDLCQRGKIAVRHDGRRAYCDDVRLVG